MANRDQNSSGSDRDKYRDNDDARAIAGPESRDDVGSDSRAEARGDARENVGNHARGTDAHPTGPEGNDRTKHRSDRPDVYDDDLQRDNQRGHEGQGMSDLARDTRSGMSAMPFPDDDARQSRRPHQGQAESPVELTHYEPEKKKEGHH